MAKEIGITFLLASARLTSYKFSFIACHVTLHRQARHHLLWNSCPLLIQELKLLFKISEGDIKFCIVFIYEAHRACGESVSNLPIDDQNYLLIDNHDNVFSMFI